MSVIYGASHPLAILLVAVAAAGGGLLRRWLGAMSAGPLVQVFVAATLAGAVGAAAAHLDLGGSAAVVAICPAMVLVPGPHILNGALDLLDLRVSLGLARLAFGMMLLTAIGGGLILGLQAGGQMLAVTRERVEVRKRASVRSLLRVDLGGHRRRRPPAFSRGHLPRPPYAERSTKADPLDR